MSTSPENGLIVILFLEATNGTRLRKTFDFTNILGNTRGVRVVIHPKGHVVQPVSEGIDIQPGHLTSIGYKVREINTLGHPYGTCLHDRQEDDYHEIHYHP